MPRLYDEFELIKSLRNDVKNLKIFSEFIDGKIENIRYEIINGMMTFVPSPKPYFGLIGSNLILVCANSLENGETLEFLSNFDIKIDDDNIYTAKGVIFDKSTVNDNDVFITNPTIVFEILTDINKHILNAKFENYQKLETLQEYVLIDLNNPQIWLYRKSNDWQVENFTFSQEFELKSIGKIIKVSELYRRMSFDEANQ